MYFEIRQKISPDKKKEFNGSILVRVGGGIILVVLGHIMSGYMKADIFPQYGSFMKVTYNLMNAVLLVQHNTVYAVDIVPEKVDMLNRRISPIQDRELQEYLEQRTLTLTATTDGASVYGQADFVIVSTPADYDLDRNYFNTSSVESVIAEVREINPEAYIVVKSTVPIESSYRRTLQQSVVRIWRILPAEGYETASGGLCGRR